MSMVVPLFVLAGIMSPAEFHNLETIPVQPEPAAVQTSNNTVWDRLAKCESNGDWSTNTGNGYYGGIQFSLRSWRWVDGKGMPHEASRSEQIARGEKLLALQGWGAWPVCSRVIGVRS